MERVLQHLVVGLASGACVAVALIVASTAAMLTSLFVTMSEDSSWTAVGFSAVDYQVAPFAGLVAFALGLAVSVWRGRFRSVARGGEQPLGRPPASATEAPR
jgi:hypothetical protein